MVVKDENDFEISEFYRSRIFEKVENLMNILKISKKNRKVSRLGKEREEKKRRRALALRVIRAETRLTVYRSLPYARSTIRDQEWTREKWYTTTQKKSS